MLFFNNRSNNSSNECYFSNLNRTIHLNEHLDYHYSTVLKYYYYYYYYYYSVAAYNNNEYTIAAFIKSIEPFFYAASMMVYIGYWILCE